MIADAITVISCHALTVESTLLIGARCVPVARVNIALALVNVLTERFSVAFISSATIAVVPAGEVRAFSFVNTWSWIADR